MTKGAPAARLIEEGEDPEEAVIDQVFFALSDPVRRKILEQLDEDAKLVSELAAPFDISLQAVSRHIQVLVRAGLVQSAADGPDQPVQPGGRPDPSGGGLAQSLQQVLA